jgi:transcription-repair coupling factor (superfamily II helicase)
MKDLEIRGAGNLLGVEQSGYIASVGFDLYSRLLAEAVEDLKQGQKLEEEKKILQPQVPAVSLPLTAYIPEEYIIDLSTRLDFYQRLAAVRGAQEVEGIAAELSDRFGPVPQAVKNLLYIMEIKQLAAAAMVKSISTEDRQAVLYFDDTREIDRLSLTQDFRYGVKASSSRIKLDIKLLGVSWQDILRKVLRKAAVNG